MKCTLCGYEFNEVAADRACSGCSLMKSCKLIKCPNCGFETPAEPKWLKKLRKKIPPKKKS